MSKKLSDKHKSFILVAVILVLFIICFFAGFIVKGSANSKSIVELENTISELTESIETGKAANKELRDLNTKLTDGIGELKEYNRNLRDSNNELTEYLREANGIIGNLGKGAEEADVIISGIIETIDSLIETVEKTGKKE